MPAPAGTIRISRYAVISCSRPNRLRPATASRVASAIPSASFRSRVSTLPRNGTIVRSGRQRNICDERRSDDEPSLAPCGISSQRLDADSDTNASRTSLALAEGHAKHQSISGRLSSPSVLATNARPDRPRSPRARPLDLLGEQALAAHFAERRVRSAYRLRCSDGPNLDPSGLRHPVGLGEQPLHKTRLDQSQRRAAGCRSSGRAQIAKPGRSLVREWPARSRLSGFPKQCGFWASRPVATRPPRRLSSASPTPRPPVAAASFPISSAASSMSTLPMAAVTSPSFAARAHVSHLDHIIARAAAPMPACQAQCARRHRDDGRPPWPDRRGVLVGFTTAQGARRGKPSTTSRADRGQPSRGACVSQRGWTDGLAFPYLLLLVSGGHSQFVLVRGVGDYERWGTTIDDALGEAFDKVAKLLDLGVPGGPEVEETRPHRRILLAASALPRPLLHENRLDFSVLGPRDPPWCAAAEVIAAADAAGCRRHLRRHSRPR